LSKSPCFHTSQPLWFTKLKNTLHTS